LRPEILTPTLHSDCVSHLAEEIPNARVNIPKAVLAQYGVGFVLAILYIITVFYSVNDVPALFSNPWPFPLAELYRQSTNSAAGSLGLLIVLHLPSVCTTIGCYITCGRMLWTLGRDSAAPFSSWLGQISPTHENPFNATLACGIINSLLGIIYVGNSTAFSAFIGSFILLSSLSYLAFLLPNILSRRSRVTPGPFTMPAPVFYTLAVTACAYMIVWIVIYCFPFAKPFDAQSMNYSSVIVGGLTLAVAGWYVVICRRGYVGPGVLVEGIDQRMGWAEDVVIVGTGKEGAGP
jgi:choline transport protein